MWTVYKVLGSERIRTVAIKRIRVELLARPHAGLWLHPEVQAVAVLNRPSIIRVLT